MPKIILPATTFLSVMKYEIKEHDIKILLGSIQNYHSTSDRIRLGTKLLTLNGGKYPEKVDIPCWWDRHKFNTPPIGIPVAKEIDKGIYIFYVEGFFNSYEACYSFIKSTKEQRYKSALNDLKILFNIEYPGKKLKETIDWRLIKGNGGDIPVEEARKNSSIIKSTDIIYRIPAIIEFRKNESL